jgi:pyrroline-5-carboxylate reductase
MSLRGARVGFIGVGKMGESILRGALARGVLRPEDVWVQDVVPVQTARAREAFGVHVAESVPALLSAVDWVLYCAKPQNVPEVLPVVGEHLGGGQWLASIAAGVPTSALEGYLPDKTPVVRVMPNIAASVGAAATVICGGAQVEDAHLQSAEALFGAVGRTLRLPESLMDAVTGLSGSGPAFVFVVIEALADAGVQTGLPFDQALLLASQTVFGAAKMVLESGEHPALLKTRVTSPGGTTAAGLLSLERGGLRAALAEAVVAATRRSRELGGGGAPK